MPKKTTAVVGTADVEVRRQKLNLQYKFSRDELLGLGHDLAEAQQCLRQLDDDRKRIADEWKARISSKEAEINSLSNRVGSGYEYRDIECEIALNNPPGKKTCVRLDTNEVVWVKDLTEEEKQRTLNLQVAEPQEEQTR